MATEDTIMDMLEFQLEEELISCNLNELGEVCKHLGIQDSLWTKLSRIKLIKVIRKAMDIEEEEEVKVKKFRTVLSFLGQVKEETEDGEGTRDSYPEESAAPGVRASGAKDPGSSTQTFTDIPTPRDNTEVEQRLAELLRGLKSDKDLGRLLDIPTPRQNTGMEQQLEDLLRGLKTNKAPDRSVYPGVRTSGSDNPASDHRLSTDSYATSSGVTVPTTVLKREFKITGSINGQKRGDKPSLSYISLTHQIEQGERQRYSEEEIIMGVIRAMQPGLRLRTVLETLPNLQLSRMRMMLRCHYHEKSATELFQELANSVQSTEEGADEFLIRAYETRQKLVFAGKETGKDAVPFDHQLIQSIFIKAIETGLTNEAIRNKIRPWLATPNKEDTDEDFEKVNDQLLVEISSASISELERSTKLKKVEGGTNNTGKKPRVSFTGISEEEDRSVTKGKKMDEAPQGQVVSLLQALQTQLGSLTLEVNQLKSEASGSSGTGLTRGGQQTTPRVTPKCTKCTKEKVARCTHCLRCGSEDHFIAGCKKSWNEKEGGNSSRHR